MYLTPHAWYSLLALDTHRVDWIQVSEVRMVRIRTTVTREKTKKKWQVGSKWQV